MSIQVINQVWNTPCKTHTQKLVLIALADNANDQRVCWPSIDYLARRCDLSRQGVMNQIELLLKSKLLKVKKSDGRVNVYELFPNQSTPWTGSKAPVHAVDPSTALTPPVNHVDYHQSTPLTPPVHAVDPNRKEPSDEPPRTVKRESDASLSLSVEVFNAWNETAKATDGLPACLVMSDSRRRKLAVRVKDPFFSANWKASLEKVSKSAFCLGCSERGWRASLDWFIQPDTTAKIMEGKYDTNPNIQNRSQPRSRFADRNKGTLNEGQGHVYAEFMARQEAEQAASSKT